MTAAQSIAYGEPSGPTRFCRATHRGRRWVCNADIAVSAFPLFESALPALAAPDGTPGLLAGVSDDGFVQRSGAEGQPGTWHDFGGRNAGYPQVLGEVPPSPALPNGRVLLGVWNGVLYSSDPGADSTVTFTRSSAYGQAAYIVYSFAFRPVAGHPYGGVALAGVHDIAFGGEFGGAALLASEDGGVTWTAAHRFTAAEVGLTVVPGMEVTHVEVAVLPDGVIWAGVSQSSGGFPLGGIMRSLDGGATWERAGAGFIDVAGRSFQVNQFALARDGRLYAATSRGVWRTTGVAVAGEAPPSQTPRLGVTVRPNPASGRVSVAVTSAGAEPVRVVVLDARGREVAVVLDGVVSGERVVSFSTSALAPGVYVVRASAGEATATARLIVAR